MTGYGRRTPRKSGVALAALALSTVVYLSGCGQELPVDIPGLTSSKISDEEQILRVLEDVHRGMQSRKIYKVLAHVSRTYTDAEGRDYNGLQNYLKDLFKNYKEIQITRVQPRVTVQGNRARAVETFGTRAEPFNPNAHPPIVLEGQMNVYLEKMGGRWQIVEWGRML